MQLKRIFTFSLLACSSFLFQHAQAQHNFSDELQQQFRQYSSNAFTEKAYLHVDRNFYVAGEIVWFKAYVTDGLMGYPSNLSKIVYADIIDKDNKPFLQAKTALQNGMGSGSFYLPTNLPSGAYKIRAYTNWMKNFDAAFYFEKAITIINTMADTGLPAVDSTRREDIQFFPEGGNLVKNIESKVAFRMTDKNGKGVQHFSGAVIADGRDTIVRFSALHAGIGTFMFTPLTGHSYSAVVRADSGMATIKKMPGVLENGYVMKLAKPSKGIIGVTVQSTEPGAVYLFAHTRGAVKLVQTRALQSGGAQFNIDENVLGEGITQFTLFNGQQQPVCERLYCKRPTDKLVIDVATNEAAYSTRAKVLVNIASADISRQTLAANMSLAVYRVDSLQSADENNIFSYLWLSADLKGTVESPAYYFSNADDSTNEALDNLMLTHGWRRFKWTDIQQHKKPSFEFLPEFEGHILTAKITDTFTKKPFTETAVYLSAPGEYTQFYNAKSDAGGNLRFYTRGMYGPGELVTQAEGMQQVKYNIDINTPFSGKFSGSPLPPLTLSPTLKHALETNSINAQVQRKYAADMLRKYRIPQIDSTPFYGKADERYLLDDYTRFTTMEEVLREYVQGVLVGRTDRKFRLTAFDMPNNRLFRDNPLVLLDGVPVQDIDRIMSYDPLKVRKVEVVKRRYYFGSLLFDGILNFITYKGNLEEFQMEPHAIVVDFEGMQLQREFYAPVYETPEQTNSHSADFRNLLYWLPDVATDNTGHAQVQFYTSDLKGKYIGVIEGITTNGKAGYTTFTFDVAGKKP